MKVGVFGSDYQLEKQNLIRRLFDKLSALEAEIYVDSDFHLYLTDALGYEPPASGLLSDETFDLDIALSVGGDGTFLRTAARVNRQAIPILGINTGRLGFLAEVGSNEIEDTLDEVFKNYYKIEERSLLCLHTEERLYTGYNYALNEIAVLKRDTSSMITIHVSLGDDYLASYQADGLIIATPTGSTAYSMSVNGPIIVPQSNSLVISPVAPHSLNVRPLVIPDTSVISLTVESRNEYFLVALDGRSEVFSAGAVLTVSKADYTTKVVKRYNHTFYETLREKLMWGADVRSK
ncbi:MULTISPECIES: NAD kinase [unclassified Parabacteroides]|uniref:NAD kinase n=1 Tax=unclassified Parabacteroides TaxID=2649774 RepID=UPI0024737DD4|nr:MULTISPECIES: NAD kinase [unclassified Parabacteroides]